MDNNKLSNYDLCMLEHLTYMKAESQRKAWENVGINIDDLSEGTSLQTFLDGISDETLEKLDKMGNTYQGGDFISGNEWAAILRYMKNNEKIKSLSLTDTMSKDDTLLALCFSEGNESKSAIVAFKGTASNEEWGDNVEVIDVSDTQAQVDAYNYVDNLRYDDITVVGHSKGGNKAMYCSIRSDKVSKCVSMDGQGFSDKFLKNYAVQIAANSNKIINISYCSDYVHGLMIQIPGSNQIYTGTGYGSNGVRDAAECHSPNSLFTYTITTDENSNQILNVTNDFVEGEETRSIFTIRSFTEYLIYSDCPNKSKMVSYLTQIVGGGLDKIFDNIMNSQDTNSAALFVAYFIKYLNEANVSPEEVWILLVDIHVIDTVGDKTLVKMLENKFNINLSKYNIDDLMLLRLLFSYFKGNESDQNYVIAKLINTFKNEDPKSKELVSKILKSLKSHYDSINFNLSQKTEVENLIKNWIRLFNGENDNLALFTLLGGAVLANGSFGMQYGMEGIRITLNKLEELINIYSDESFVIESNISGKAYDKIQELNRTYNRLNSIIIDMIKNVYNQIKAVQEAVITLENV